MRDRSLDLLLLSWYLVSFIVFCVLILILCVSYFLCSFLSLVLSHTAFMQPTIVLLREGTDQSQGIPQLVSNINACQVVGDILKTTLGPRGMDKLIHDVKSVTISNDGATIIKLLDIVHPAAKTLTDIAKSQDDEVGDGTTSVVVLACELLTSSKQFVEAGVHPQTVIKGMRAACKFVLQKIREMEVNTDSGNI